MKIADRAFNNLMLPILESHNLSYTSVEGSKRDLENCVDGYLNGIPTQLRGQFDTQKMFTFTIKECRDGGGLTGKPKIEYLISKGLLYPRLWLQWYGDVDKTVVYGWGMCLTLNLLHAIDYGLATLCNNEVSVVHSTLWSVPMNKVEDAIFYRYKSDDEICAIQLKRLRKRAHELQ